MRNWKRLMAMVVAAALALPLVAAPAPAVTVKNTFKRQPAEAATALKRVIGKPISTGYVFIDGKYIPPPYKVERNGLVIRVNNMQVTNPVVPWAEEWNSGCLSSCSGSVRPLVELCVDPAGFSG